MKIIEVHDFDGEHVATAAVNDDVAEAQAERIREAFRRYGHRDSDFSVEIVTPDTVDYVVSYLDEIYGGEEESVDDQA